MKSDREMIESLIKRRDEYFAQKTAQKKRSFSLGLIPKTALPVFGIFAVVACVLFFNGVFDREKVNVDLVGAGSSNLHGIEDYTVETSAAEKENNITDITEEKTADNSAEPVLTWEQSGDSSNESNIERIDENEVKASDILNAVQNDLSFIQKEDGEVKINVLSINCPENIVCDGTIYSFVDPERTDYHSLGFYPEYAVLLNTLPQAVVFETAVESNEEDDSAHIFGSLYEIKEMEGYAVAVFDKRLWLYKAEKAAQFTIGDKVYFTHLSMADSLRYNCSDIVVDKNDEYTVYYATDNLKKGQTCDEEYEPIYIVMNNDYLTSKRKEAWICYGSSPAVPEKYRLKINIKGRIEDTVENLVNYYRNYSNRVFDVDQYFIVSWDQDSIVDSPNYREFRYNGQTYTPVNDYPDPEAILVQEQTVKAGESEDGGSYFCTVFGAKDRDDIKAVFCNGVLHYFILSDNQ